MNKGIWAGLALALSWSAGAADAAGPSLCARLADEARRLPAAAWAGPEPLGRWLNWAEPGEPSAAAQALAADPQWRERVGASAGGVVGVRHLAGTPVHLVESFAGTANCQSAVLVEARAGGPARELPAGLDDVDLCTTRSARLAQVFGHPALVVGGTTTMTSEDHRYRITPWAGTGWGPSCRVEWRLRTALESASRYCAPGAAVCEAGQPVARQLALAYESGGPLEAQRLAGGRQPDVAMLDALASAPTDDGALGDLNLPLPLFGADRAALAPMDAQFSNADPRRLPVFIGGRWWLAIVGRGGVGWREGGAVLVALFAPPGRAGDAVASYQFLVGPAGLREAVARDGR